MTGSDHNTADHAGKAVRKTCWWSALILLLMVLCSVIALALMPAPY